VQAGLACGGDFLACGQQVLVELSVVVQAGRRGGAHEAAFEDVALPVHVADQAALAVVAATGLDGIGAVRRDLGQDQCPGPTDRGVAGRVGTVLAQAFLVLRRAGRFTIDHERARALVVVLGRLGRRTGVDPAALQQAIQRRGLHRIDVDVGGAGEVVGAFGETEFRIDTGLGEARAATQRAGFTADLLVQGERGRTGHRWCRYQVEAGRNRALVQIAHRLGGDVGFDGGRLGGGGGTTGQGRDDGKAEQRAGRVGNQRHGQAPGEKTTP